jgi:hypothetical protein
VSSAICNITFDCADPSALARFWGQVTGLPVIEEPQLVQLGATVVSDQRPDIGWVIMADPEGNEFCVEMSRAELDALAQAEPATED